MINRWTILAVLFLARTTMAFQFQGAASLSPFLIERYGISLVEIGVLIGLYLAPGVVVALPGGAIAARFGEKRVVALSMGLMLIGAALASFGPGWGWVTTGRLVAGAGGVVLNIVMTKMLVDWFAGREVSTAMAIFINSWPVGIALGLVVLPWLGATAGLQAAQIAVLAVIAAGLILFVAAYRPPQGASAGSPSLKVAAIPVLPLAAAGLIWAFYNAALAMVFSFGPALLIERGLGPAASGSMTSLFMFVFAVAVPFGGVLADRTGRRDLVIAMSLLSFVLLIPLALIVPPAAVMVVFVAVGIGFAFAAGPIMTLPASVLPPEVRTFGMGVFFTIYYAVMMIAPPVGGVLAEGTGTVGAAFLFGAALSLACVVLLAAFRVRTGPENLATR
jgi:MFS family permease